MPPTPPKLVTNGIVDVAALLAYLKVQRPKFPTVEKKQKGERPYRDECRGINRQKMEQACKTAAREGRVVEPTKEVEGVNKRPLELEAEMVRHGETVEQDGKISRLDETDDSGAAENAQLFGLGYNSSTGTLEG